jgi:Ca2+-binding EF-hand superfamily protein
MRKISVLILLYILAGAVWGQDMPPGPPRIASFADLDKNKDKKISRDEFPGPPQFFDRLDENKDGFIDEEEWNRARGRMGGGPRVAERLMLFLDSDGDSKVSREEFSQLTALFDLLDKDRDGSLSQAELGQFFQAIEEAQNRATGGVNLNDLFEKSDKNRDGKLTPDEIANDRLFKSLDLDGDGVVTRAEAARALRELARRSRR